MIDLKILRKNPDFVVSNLSRRGFKFDLDLWQSLEKKRKEIQSSTEELQSELNQISKDIGIAKSKGEQTDNLEKKAASLSNSMKTKNADLNDRLQQINEFLLSIPNLLDEDVPKGDGENSNREIRSFGDIREFNFKPLDHLTIGDNHNGIDMESAVKIAGSRFKVLKSDFATLHRALIQLMLDTHINEHGYTEVYVPFIVNSDSLLGTGQLPKFEEDQFKVDGDQGFYLAPTAEVPVTNLLKDTIIESKDLPVKYVSHTPCFRREAGSHGKDTKGIMRLHQFEKVELVQAVEESESEQALEELTSHAEVILKKLDLPYRVVSLCEGDIGFSAAKTYDLEVWVPSQGKYREISSCSNCRSFQSRRILARWRNHSDKPELLSTLNGSGLALSRTLLAILENYQQENQSIAIPSALESYFKKKSIDLVS
tara:strand:+ start:15100 stop:16377 length:1278 start_codon:yes stop_codon:yes gene_type:complete